MATITINADAYNNAKLYADSQHIGVDELIVTLINKLTYPSKGKEKFSMLSIDQLEPELQEIISMPRIGHVDADDLNGDQARIDYYKEKYSL